jgi:hypothetical protein
MKTALYDNLVELKVTLEDSMDEKVITCVLQKVREEDLEELIY